MDYVNLAAVVWLTFYILSTASLINNNLGRTVVSLNLFPLVLSIISLFILGVSTIGGVIK